MKRASASLQDGLWNIIESELKGTSGSKNSEVKRNIRLAYLSEKGCLGLIDTKKVSSTCGWVHR